MKKITTKKTFYLAVSLVFSLCFMETKAQLKVGAIAPDWTFTDTKGVSHTLYSYLNQGKTVVIDISATWCGPCWQYHKSGELDNFYKTYGPAGTNKAMVFMFEGDGTTNGACLSGSSGCNSSTQGNWLANTDYPIIDVPTAQAKTFTGNYKLPYWPTVYLICPDKKIALASDYNQQTGSGNVTYTFAQLKAGMSAKCANTTSVNEVDIDSDVKVYPSPSSGNVSVTIGGSESGQAKVKIYDMVGALISETNGNLTTSRHFELNLSELPNGLYFVDVISGSGHTTKKIVLNK